MSRCHRLFFLALFLLYGPVEGCLQNVPQFALDTYAPVELPVLIDSLEHRFGISFAYPSGSFDQVLLGPYHIRAPDLDSLLSGLFRQTDIVFRKGDDGGILLRFRDLPMPGTKEVIHLAGLLQDPDGNPVAYASIQLDTARIGAWADEEGRFEINIPSKFGDRNLLFQMLGFRDVSVPVSDLEGSGRITMQRENIALEEVVIIDRLPLLFTGSPGHPALGVSDPSASYGLQLGLRDVQRMLQYLPGVSADDDLSAEIRIRGSLDDETLIQLDGIPIYSSDHFYGIFGSVNSLFVQDVELYRNALPIEYGGKTGGMLRMDSREGSETGSFRGDINTLGLALYGAGPVSDRLAIQVAGRSSYLDVADSKLFDWVGTDPPDLAGSGPESPRARLIRSSPDFTFYDLNTRLDYRVAGNQGLSFRFFHSADRYREGYQTSFRTNGMQGPVRNEETYEKEEDWGNLGGALQYRYSGGNDMELHVNLYGTGFETEGAVATTLERISMGNRQLQSVDNRQSNSIREAGLSADARWTQDIHTWKAGISATYRHTELDLRSDDQQLLVSRSDATETTIFLSDELQLGDRLRLAGGVRLSYYDRTKRLYPSPRINGWYEAGRDLTWKFSAGWQHQYVRELDHENRFGQTFEYLVLAEGIEYPVGNAFNLMAGMQFRSGNWTLDLELYRKSMDGVLEHASIRPGFREGEVIPSSELEFTVFEGSGLAMGADLLLSYQSRKYTTWLAYTLSKTTHSFPEIDHNRAFPAQDDRRHRLKWIQRISLGKWDLSGSMIFSSGKPYTDLRNLMDDRDRRLISPADRISYLPPYHRIDLGISYRFRIGSVSATANCSVFNLLNRNNVKYLQYVYSLPQIQGANEVIGSETSLLDRTLSLGLMFSF